MKMILCIFAMAALILDSRTAMTAAAEAVELCLRTAVPSLFPFFVLACMMVPWAARLRLPRLGRLLKVPAGWESIFLLGCVGGYPVGAQCIAQGCGSSALDRKSAQRMLGFCTNCGPSFLFGIVGAAFGDSWAAAKITGIGILSALLVGILWPGAVEESGPAPRLPEVSLPQAVNQALRSMASVCAWIILGEVFLTFLTPLLPSALRVPVIGILELTNGCLLLPQVPEAIRFPAACGFTTFGGLCVAMQVKSICGRVDLSTRSYLPQKALQALIAVLLGFLFA